jgi:aryl-alcohol dehydrogenase-like predicted oxidoreductase
MRADRVDRVKRMKAIADRLGVTRAQLALAWCAAQPGISSVITGATHPDQLKENLGALDVTISPEAAKDLEELFPV